MGSLKSYVTGFVLSLCLTLLSFFTVTYKILSGWQLLGAISIFATYQAITQLFLFLHVGQGEKPRWNLIFFVYMGFILAIILLGSLWVMNHLDYRMMGT
ncbi:MAG: cytochrome o ubiquinol oxidase subunit IV [Myxococcaceae bacterium]